jgi:hypothetical protein
MASLNDSFATEGAIILSRPDPNVDDPPGGTAGRVGVRHGVDEAPVPDAQSTVDVFSSEACPA